MQRPIAHQIIATSSRPFRQSSWATVLVALLHAGLIYALIRGLEIKLANILPPPITAYVLTQPPPQPVQLPLPPPTQATLPQTDTMPPPIVKIEEPQAHGTITLKTSDQPTPIPTSPVAAPESAHAVPGTHTIPDYPVLSRRLGEQGVVLLRIAITDSGRIDAVTITRSSGYSRLDGAAREWVMRYWRYTPATDGARAVAAVTEASVVFNLKNAATAP